MFILLLKSDNVCLSVCLSVRMCTIISFRQPGDFKNCRILLKLCTRVRQMNTLAIFPFFENLDFSNIGMSLKRSFYYVTFIALKGVIFSRDMPF